MQEPSLTLPFSRRAIAALRRFAFMAFAIITGVATAAPANFETGAVTVLQNTATQWTTVNFTRSFAAPPVVVMSAVTSVNGEAFVMRVRNVTADSFQYQVDEWENHNGYHPAETFHFFALSPGTHVFGTQRWQVGRVTGVNRTATTVPLTGFTAAPVVLTQVESTANLVATDNPRALNARINAVTSTNFQVNLETQEAYTTAISNEDIGYIAVSAGTGYLDGKVLSAVTTAAGTTHTFATVTFPAARTNPIVVAQSQTKNDTNPGELRMQTLSTTSVQVRFQEDTSLNTDVTHTAEAIGYLVVGDMSGETAAKIEVGDLNITQSNVANWTTVTLANTYTTPVVVMGPLSFTNGTPATVRVRNVTTNSFQFQVDRWDHVTSAHNYLEHLSYIVAESGTHAVGGVVWQAGQKTGVTQTTTTQALSTSFPNAPVVFSQVVTTADPAAVVSRVSAVTPTQFSVELDESEIDATAHAAETVHWIAMTQGSSNFFSTDMRFQAGTNTTLDSNFRTVTFSRMHADPFVFAATQSKNDPDPTTIRWRYLFANRVDLVVHEDGHPLQFGETGNVNVHSAETTAYLIVQGAADVDEDGAPDAWESTVGLNPADAADGALDPDADNLTNQMEFHNRLDFSTSSIHTTFTGGIVTVGNAVTSGFEVNDRSLATPAPINARYRIYRNGGFAPMSIQFTVAGTAATDTNRAPASPSDYSLWTSETGGTAVTNSITIPLNAQSVDVYVRPVVDAIDEYPEGLRMTAVANPALYTLGTTTSTVVLINDAQNIPANERLFVGTFLPQGSAVTSASGFATIILNGANSAGRISTSFYGLTTPQTTIDGSHVHYANAGGGVVANGTIMYGEPDGLPNGLLADYPWTIVDSAGVKGQQIIDALYRKVTGVNLYVNVHTSRYASGEIRADLSLQTGSPTFVSPGAPPAVEDLANDAEVRRECARFLTHATFGPSEAEVTALFNTIATPKTTAANRIAAFSAWIDNQWTRDQTTVYDYLRAADAEEWALRGQQPNLPEVFDNPATTTINEAYPAAPPPNNPLDWTRWNSVPSPAGAWTYRPIPPGLDRESYDPDNNNRRRAWWLLAVRAHDQLRQRVAFALEQIFVVSEREGTVGARAYGHARYYDMLADFADGTRHLQPPNGTYSTANGTAITVRNLLKDISRSPIMGKYLSHLKNQKAVFTDTNANGIQDPGEETILSPDENYAREIMQLFSIGLLELHPDGTLKLANNGQPVATYDNDDIKELSQVFTGYSFAWVQNSAANGYVPALVQNTFNGSEGAEYFHPGYENPMKNFVAYHDQSTKEFLAVSLPAYTGVATDTAAREAYANTELDGAMDALFNHPNIAPFLSRLLIQRLVTSNPSRGYIHRVAQVFADSNGATAGGVRGSLPAVVKAILLDYEARTLKNVDPQNVNGNISVNVGFGKVKEPIIRYTHLLRAFDTKTQLPVSNLSAYGYPASQLDNLGTSPTRYRFNNTTTDLAQTPHSMPSVFNWYLPDYTPGGRVASAGLVAPELQVMTENLVVRAINYHRSIAFTNIVDTAAALPTGVGLGNILGDTTGNLDNMHGNIATLITEYINNRQAVGATEISSATFLVDRLDNILCAGSLKARFPTYVAGSVDPRSVLIDQLATVSVDAPPVSITNAANRLRQAIYLITSSPEFIVQK